MALTQIGSDGLKDQAVTDPKIKDNLDYTSALEANTVTASQITSQGPALGGGTANATILDDDGVTIAGTSSGPCELRFLGTSGGDYVAFKSDGSFSGTTTFVLPDGDGSANQVLKTDGSGNLDWTTTTDTTYSVQDGELSQNNFTDADHTKLDGIAAGAEVNVQSDWNSSSGDNQILNKPTVPTVTGSTNNTICTVTGANAMQGEANLTFDGSDLTVLGEVQIGDTSNHTKELRFADSTRVDASSIKVDNGSNADLLITNDRGSGSIRLATNSAERFRITQDGRYIQGHTSSITTWGGGLNHQLHGTSWDASSQSQVRWSNDGNSSSFIFGKSRGGIGTQTIVADNDNVGQIAWVASDGTDFNNDVARIDCLIDGTPGSNVVPGELVFSTTKSTGQAYNNMKIRNDGNVEILNGNVVIGTSGKGIDFSAQTAASGTGVTPGDEVLNHYEEGTWTPTVTSTSSGTFNHSNQFGIYQRVGDWVHINGLVNATVGGTESGTVRIDGLPFNPKNTASNYGQLNCTDYGNFDHWDGQVGGYCYCGTNDIVLLHAREGNSYALATSSWGTATYMYFSASYAVN